MRKTQQRAAQLWQGRIEAAKAFPGSAAEFCRQEGIDSSSFYFWRRKLAAESNTASPFVPAVIAAQPVQASTQEESRLPDPKWIGEMLASMIRGLA